MKSTGQCYSSGEVSGLSKCNITGDLLLTSLVSIVVNLYVVSQFRNVSCNLCFIGLYYSTFLRFKLIKTLPAIKDSYYYCYYFKILF